MLFKLPSVHFCQGGVRLSPCEAYDGCNWNVLSFQRNNVFRSAADIMAIENAAARRHRALDCDCFVTRSRTDEKSKHYWVALRKSQISSSLGPRWYYSGTPDSAFQLFWFTRSGTIWCSALLKILWRTFLNMMWLIATKLGSGTPVLPVIRCN